MTNIYSPPLNKITVQKSDTADDKELLEYISSHPEVVIYHHPAWLKVLEAETGKEVIRLTAKDESGRIKGFLPLQATNGMFFGLGGLAGAPRLSSLPRTPVAGLLADDGHIAKLLLSAALELTKARNGIKLQIKTLFPDYYENELVKVIPWRENFTISLPEKEEDIKFGNPRNHRRIKWAVNKAGNEGVIIRKADSGKDIKEWYSLYLDTSRWHAVPPRSFKFFMSLFEMIPDENISLLLAVKGKRILAGSIFLMFNKTVFYSFNGRDKESLNLRPNDLIQYHGIYKACRDGYSLYDMGEVADGQEGLIEFKKKWGCESKQIFHIYYYPDGEISEDLMSDAPGNLRVNIWRKIPIILTEKLGEIINNRL